MTGMMFQDKQLKFTFKKRTYATLQNHLSAHSVVFYMLRLDELNQQAQQVFTRMNKL